MTHTPAGPELSRLQRVCFGVVALASLAIVIGSVFPINSAAGATSPPAPVLLNSNWTDNVSIPLTAWQDAMISAAQPVDVNNTYIGAGDPFAKNIIVTDERVGNGRRRADFVVSGTPLTTAEKAVASQAGKEVIEVPIAVTGLVIAFRAPLGTTPDTPFRKLTIGAIDPDTGEPTFTITPFTDPLRMRGTLLQDHFVKRLIVIADPDFLKDEGMDGKTTRFATTGPGITGAFVRSDPGAVGLYMTSYLRHVDPVRWDGLLKGANVDVGLWGPEGFPLNVGAVATRGNSSALADAIAGLNDSAAAKALAGNIGVLTLANFNDMKALYKPVVIRAVEIKNAADQWVPPTPESILAGINAGLKPDGTFVPNAAMSDATATGAYPITWANMLITQATGHTPEKANALAATIRYIVTKGQSDVQAAGEPAMPQALVKKALEGADTLVAKNCVASGWELVNSTDLGPYSPVATLPGVSKVNLCVKSTVPATTTSTAAATTTTTTTAAPSTTTTTAPPASTTSSPPTTVAPSEPTAETPAPATRRPTSPATTEPPPPPTSTTAPVTTTTTPQEGSASEPATLPFGLPSPRNQPFDRVTTMGLGGAGLYATLRKLFMRGGR